MELALNIIALFGGLGLFLYGMILMGEGLENSAGAKLEKTLEKWSNNVFKGVLMGTIVTSIIQSSSATTVMVVGFVNSGIMKLTQAVGIIMGANIGTTVTGQIISLNELSENPAFSGILNFLKPDNLSYIAIIVGLVLIFTSKTKKRKNIAKIFIGFGILFIGMGFMSDAVKPYSENDTFRNIFEIFSVNPVLGVIAGAVITAIIQSSSASVGILQAAATTGGITFGAAVPIILGQNIGTCITAILSSIGASKNGKRAAMIHLYFNIIGTIVFLIGTYTLQAIFKFAFWDEAINMSGIANFHTSFNIINTVILLPFNKLLVKLAELTIKSNDSSEAVNQNKLEERFLATPAIAVEQCKNTINQMGKTAKDNYLLALKLYDNYDKKDLEIFKENENTIDKLEVLLENYILKLSEQSLNVAENKAVSGLLHAINDFERIGDYEENITENIEMLREKNIIFTPEGDNELKAIFEAVNHIIDLTCLAYKEDKTEVAKKVEPLEEVIDAMKATLKNKHIERLQAGKCSIDSGISFLEIINNLERIADHCSSIAVYIMQNNNKSPDFNPHEYLKMIHLGENEDYKAYYKYYEDMFLKRIAL
ncbi:MAG: Na/Pi-cotransporter II-related protein [Clostridia bacterium]|nr:Na/Pi-cotransporter II-related protein [Clostridia bacterium]